MADLDELQIKITSSSKDAEEAIDKLVKSLKGLNTAIGSLDASKVNSFASAMSKLANIGTNTNTTSKAIKGMAGDIASAFGIRTKKGIDDIVASLEALYKATRNVNLNGSAENNNIYANSQKNLQDAIEANYEYKEAIDETTKSIAEYVKAQNKSGQKIAMAAMAEEYGEDFRNLTKVLGKSFNNKLKASEGATDLAKFFEDMNSAKNTDFKTGNMQELKESVDMLVVSLQNAKEKTYDFRTAISSGLISGEEAAESVMNISDKIWALIKEQDKYGVSSGLGGLVDVFKQISNVQVPDLSSLEKLNNIDVSKVASQVSNIGTSATRSQQEVENLVASLSKVETVIAGNEIKNYERGFTMKDVAPIKNVEFPPALYEQVDFFQEKMLPAIIDTENEIENLLMHMMAMSSVEPIYDAITEKFIEWKTQLMEMNGAISGDKWIVPEFKGNADFNRQQVGWISDIKPEVVEGYWYDIENAANKCLPAIVNVGEATLTTADHFKKLGESFEDVSKSSDDFNSFFDNVNESTNNIKESYEEIKSSIENILESIRNYKQVISDMESGKTAFDKTQYDEAVRGYSEATNALKNYKNELLGVEKEEQKAGKVNIFGDVLSNLVALGHELKHVSEGFEKLANIGIKTLKIAFTPLNHVVQEYKEKFDDLRDSINGFVSNIKTNLKKMSDFWKRSMRTFTFMVIRTAITAIIKEVGNAVQSLAMYSNAMGTAFNTDLSNMVADFQYLGRSIVSVFAPLLNFITPIIDAITDRIATLISYIGMLFAALGGKATFTKAKKNVTNYAESLDSASKSAKNLTMGIDELNIISENKGGGGAKPYDGWENAWEDVEIPQWIVDFSDKLKDIFDKVFDPLKTAWDRAKQYVLDGFKTMVNSLKRLFSDIGRDFLEVWNQEKTIRMFEQLFKIIGDIFRVVRNLADAFDEAWNKGKVGLHIFENIRDIASILVDHIRNVTYYMIEWAENINFSPLLDSFEELTNKMKPFAEFVGGVFEDIMKEAVLPYFKYIIEEAIPHLNETLSEVLETFNFHELRENLKPVWAAIEQLLENIHKGVTNTIGYVGKELAKFTKSQAFKKFLESLVTISKQITAARVEKVLSALAKAIIDLTKAIMGFVSSDLFLKFIETIGKWIDNHSVDQIASILSAIADAILLFKFGEFVASKLSGFFQFMSVITALRNIGSIASDLGVLSGRITETGVALSNIGAIYNPFSKLTPAVAGLKGGLASFIETLKIMKAVGIKDSISSVLVSINKFSDSIPGVIKLIGGVATAFLEFKNVKSGIEDITYALYGNGDASLNGSILKVIATVGLAAAAFTALLGFPAGLIATGVVGAVAAIKGMQDAIDQINFDHITDAIMTQGDMTISQVNSWYDQATGIVMENTQKWIDTSRDLIQNKKDIEAYSKVIEGLNSAIRNNGEVTIGMADELVKKYEDLCQSIENYIDKSRDSLIANLLSQKEYLKAQGYDVTQMINNIYKTTEAQKKAIDSALKNLNNAEQKYSEMVDKYGIESKEAADALKEVEQATLELDTATQNFNETVKEFDTSDAVRELSALGNSIDWSEFGRDPSKAIQNIDDSIREITASFNQNMDTLDEAYRLKLDEINGQLETGLINEQGWAMAISAAGNAYASAKDELVTTTTEVLDLYQGELVKKINSVAENAADTWEKGGAEISGLSKSAYIHQQCQEFLDKTIGESGLEADINALYQTLPGAVNDNVVTAMGDIVENQWQAYLSSQYSSMAYGDVKNNQFDMLNGILNQTDNLDYDTPASTFNQNSWQAIMDYARGLEYDEFGKVVMGGAANSVTESEQLFIDASLLASGRGADQFSQEYISRLQPLTDALKDLGFSYGEQIDSSFIEKATVASQSSIPTLIAGVTGLLNTEIGNKLPDVDVETPAEKLATETTTVTQEKLYGAIDAADYAQSGVLFNEKIGESITEQTEPLKTASSDIANESVESFNTAFETKLSESKSLMQTLTKYGEDVVQSFVLGINNMIDNGSVGMTVINLFTKVTTVMSEQMEILKTNFRNKLTEIFDLRDFDVTTPITALFQRITEEVTNQISILGDLILNSLLPAFMETYITPFFSIDMWQPLFDTLLNEVFVTAFTTFCEWFNEQMTIWWDEYLVVWFTVEKWNELFDPLHKIFEQRYKTFIDWWVKAMKSWWEEKTMPYFKPEFWNEKVFNPLEKNRLDHHRKFIEWWDKALKSWWDENTMPYFKKEFWDEQIFTPLRENIQDHFKKFVEWWDDSMKSWWEGHVVPYFDEDLWKKLFNYVFLAADEVFTKVREKITERISEACEAVADGCNDMCESLQKVLDLIGEVMSALQGFGELGGSVTFNYSGEFATGGFPSAGSLFLAGETGAGAELVGNVGGKTGVVSNDEITGIAEAVYETGSQESVLLAQLIGLTKQLIDKEPVILGDKEIAEMANNGQSQLGMNIIS